MEKKQTSPPSAFPKIFTVEPYSSPDDSIGNDQSETLYVRLNSNPFAAPYYIFSFTENGPAESIQLIKGQTYEFIRTDGGHPFNIGSGWREADSSITLSSTSSNDSFAVAGVASIEVGARLTLTIPESFNGGSLAYYCYSHSSMVANLVVLSSYGSEGGSLDTDTDSDGMPDASDNDYDGVVDTADAFSLDASETLDTDSDGIGNNVDTDDDGDGVADTADSFPLDSTETVDTDLDGIGNNADTDDDGDGVVDTEDAFSLDASETIDTDIDGIGNNADDDDDNDGVIDNSDVYPLNNLYSADSDGDGMADAWELLYGLDPNDPSDASSDTDYDGAVALQEFIEGTIPAGSLDVDGNGQYDALTDGLLLLRGMFGLSEGALISGAVASDAAYTSSGKIVSRIDMLGDLVDIDGNDRVDALTDGLIILRYLFGLRGDVLINGVIASDATVTSADGVGAKMESLMPAL